jgi:KDO2-lipid IV(A) lauroyltransferase
MARAGSMPMKKLKTWLLVGLLRWFSCMSNPTRLRAGRVITWLTMKLAGRRIRIVRRNLELCFPEESAETRERWLRQHFRALGQSFVDRGVLWYGTQEAIRNIVRLHNGQHITDLLTQGKPVLILAPHFVGLDAGAMRVIMDIGDKGRFEGATMYTPQRDPVVDAITSQGRGRFHKVHQVSRRDGVRGLMRHLQNCLPVYYLPDMDFGIKGAAFVPFFGISTATLLSTAQLARRTPVVPVISYWDPDTGCYDVMVHPAMADFPGTGTLEEATARLNREIEGWIRPCPSQYYWVHRRFKTRPAGEPSLYQ